MCGVYDEGEEVDEEGDDGDVGEVGVDYEDEDWGEDDDGYYL